MAIGTAAGLDIIEAHLLIPQQGAWTVDLVLDVDSATDLAGKIDIDLSGLTLSGTAVRGGPALGVTTLRVVGGAGGLGKLLTPKDYRQVPLRLPVQDALAAVGEVLSSVADATALDYQLSRWVTFAETAAEMLDSIAEKFSLQWRVIGEGTVWIGTDAFPAVSFDYDLLSGDPHLDVVELGVESPSLVPGVSFLGRNVASVEHVISEAGIRSVVTFA